MCNGGGIVELDSLDLSILQTARKMKAKGFNIAVICEITGLSEAEIERLD